MTTGEHDPDAFREKLRYWRERGAFGVSYQGGQDFFHNNTIREEQKRIVAEAAAKGIEAVPYKSVHGNA